MTDFALPGLGGTFYFILKASFGTYSMLLAYTLNPKSRLNATGLHSHMHNNWHHRNFFNTHHQLPRDQPLMTMQLNFEDASSDIVCVSRDFEIEFIDFIKNVFDVKIDEYQAYDEIHFVAKQNFQSHANPYVLML